MKQCATCKHWISTDHINKRSVCRHPSGIASVRMAYNDSCERWESLYPPQVVEVSDDDGEAD
jgi:hypothetical protein